MTKDEALKLALEFIENSECGTADLEARIKEALAQPVSSHGNAEDLYVEMSKHLNCPHCGGSGHIDDVAQTQEPVAWKLPDKNVVFWEDTKEVDEYHGFEPTIPLYPHPQRTWVGLTDEEIDHIYTGIRAVHHEIDSYVFARAIETKLKEKNSV